MFWFDEMVDPYRQPYGASYPACQMFLVTVDDGGDRRCFRPVRYRVRFVEASCRYQVSAGVERFQHDLMLPV
jgi:hypothetical protein